MHIKLGIMLHEATNKKMKGGKKMALPMCQLCGACPGCKHAEDYITVELPCINRIVSVCKCCLEAIKKAS